MTGGKRSPSTNFIPSSMRKAEWSKAHFSRNEYFMEDSHLNVDQRYALFVSFNALLHL